MDYIADDTLFRMRVAFVIIGTILMLILITAPTGLFSLFFLTISAAYLFLASCYESDFRGSMYRQFSSWAYTSEDVKLTNKRDPRMGYRSPFKSPA